MGDHRDPERVRVGAVQTGSHRTGKGSRTGSGHAWFAGVLLVFVLIAGPTLLLLRGFIESIGTYLQNLLRLSFELGATRGEEGLEWTAGWTTFYWGWWISWAPFVGIFIARISRGRTVREFVVGVLLVPTVLSLPGFSVLGGTALHQEIVGEGGVVAEQDGAPLVTEEGALFGLLDTLPASLFVSTGVLRSPRASRARSGMRACSRRSPRSPSSAPTGSPAARHSGCLRAPPPG